MLWVYNCTKGSRINFFLKNDWLCLNVQSSSSRIFAQGAYQFNLELSSGVMHLFKVHERCRTQIMTSQCYPLVQPTGALSLFLGICYSTI